MGPRVTWFDRAISKISPNAARRRVAQRHAFDVLARKYEGAAVGRRTDGWSSRGTSADLEVMAGGRLLRDRMRDLVRNNPHAAKAVSVLTNNIVGDGIMPRANSGDEALNKKVNALFARWSKECDAEGQLDFFGMQTLAVREMVEGGEVLIRKRLRRISDGLSVPLQIQIQEADLLDQNRVGVAVNGNIIVQGVEFNQIGQRVNYWMFPHHPGNIFYDPRQTLQSRPISATDVIHLYEKQRVQSRGTPWGAPVIRSLWDLANYEEAELERKRLEACMVGIVTGGDETDMRIGMDGSPEENRAGVVDADGALIERFEPGMFAYARGGRDIKFNQPAQSASYEAYKRASLRTIASGFRIPYELMSGDLSGVNYSSIRAGLLEFRRLISSVQWQMIIPIYCQGIWDWFIEAAYLAGEIDVAHVPVEWCPPKFVSVDPLKDATAELLSIRTGTRTLPEIIAEHGRNPDDVYAEIKATNEKLDALGIILDCDPRKVAKTGAMQAADAPGVNAKDE